MENIQDMLNKVWATTINSYKFDILGNRLDINLSQFEGNKKNQYTLSFLGVTTFYFINDDTENRKNIFPLTERDKKYNFELTSVIVLNDLLETKLIAPEDKVSKYGWLNQCVGAGNIVLELSERTLLLEARAVELNGERMALPL
jgi:hypothetical protein